MRNLTKPPPFNDGTQGKLCMWIDLIPKIDLKLRPVIKIEPPPRYDMELRVVIWETRGCVFKDLAEGCNDIYVRAGICTQVLNFN